MNESIKVVLSNTGREVHVIGREVAVCVDTHSSSESVLDTYGGRHVVPVRVRNTPVVPYIQFLRLTQGAEGCWIEREATVAQEGHLTTTQARQFASELEQAIAYIESGGWETGRPAGLGHL